ARRDGAPDAARPGVARSRARLRDHSHEAGRLRPGRRAVGALPRAPSRGARRFTREDPAHRDSPRDRVAELMPRARLMSALAIAVMLPAAGCSTTLITGLPAPSDSEPAKPDLAEADEAELLARVEVYDDPDLVDYLASVVEI